MARQLSTREKLKALAEFVHPVESGIVASRAAQIEGSYVIEPNMPVGIYLQEAHNIYRFTHHDRDALERKGLNWKIIEELPKRMEYLREAEANYWNARYGESPLGKKYNELHEKVKTIYDQLLRDLEFILEETPKTKRHFDDMRKEDSALDFLEDTLLLVAYAKDYTTQLQQVGFDLNQLELIKSYIDDLFELTHGYRFEFYSSGCKAQRNTAYTFLCVVVEEIRRCARYALWHDKKRLRGYASEYFRKSSRKKKDDES